MSTAATSGMKLFTGASHPALGDEICKYLDISPGNIAIRKFSDGESYCQIKENIRGADVFFVQPTGPPANHNLMELLIMLDAAKRSSASRITAVLPYYGYARQDRKDRPRVPISAKLVADLLTKGGADRILTMDLHSPAIQGFFDIPVDHLFAAPVLVEHIEKHAIPDLVVVSPDAGGVERARAFAKRLGGVGLAIMDKRRPEPNVAETLHVVGDVKGCNALIVDDIIDTAGTVVSTAKSLLTNGVKKVYACFTHGILSGPARERLDKAPLETVWITNTIPLLDTWKDYRPLNMVSVAALLGEAISRIHCNSSVTSLFD
ncbi:MAG: ribose-phosphate pyrophosphokinase [Acidobacteriota bacterium]